MHSFILYTVAVLFTLFHAISNKNSAPQYATQLNSQTYPFVSAYYDENEIEQCKKHGDEYFCIRKCCRENYSLNKDMCVPDNNSNIEMQFHLDQRIEETCKGGHFFFLTGAMRCVHGINDRVPISNESEFMLESKGKIFLVRKNRRAGPDRYCVDLSKDTRRTIALCCPEDVEKLAWRDGMQTMGMIISMPFLVITFFVYVILPGRNLYRKSLMCYIFGLFMAYLLLVSSRLHPGAFSAKNCKILAISCLFFFVASFFWLNVISINIWQTFRGVLENEMKTRRRCFIWYSIYAWGVPLLLIALVTGLTLSDIWPKDLWYNPGIGDGQCWFKSGISEFLYLYCPICIIIIINVVLFCLTARNIRNIQENSGAMTGDSNHGYKKDKQRFEVYLKLMIVMGVNWSLEVLSWAVNCHFGQISPIVWYITDFWNAFIGVFIFFIFVFKRHIWSSLKSRYNPMKEGKNTVRIYNSQETSISNRVGH